MAVKAEKPCRLRREIQELAEAMHANGTMDDGAYAKITMRDIEKVEATSIASLTGDEIRSLREQAHMSQAVFAQILNVTVGYVSQLERGIKRPAGAALKLLNVIKSKGIEAVL